MLKKRLIACLIIKDNLIVQSQEFKNYFPIGKPNFSIEFVARWDVDEIILLDISDNRNYDYFLLPELLCYCTIR